MNWYESVLYGLISGLAEFLPISSAAHRSLMQTMLNAPSVPLREAIIHIAVLAALLLSCRNYIGQLRRVQKKSRRRRKEYTQAEIRGRLELRLVKTAAISMIFGLLILRFIIGGNVSSATTTVLLIINGFILYIPSRMMQGNKDSRSMSALDGLLIGLFSSLGFFSGISRVGIGTSVGICRGADKAQAFRWALLLSIPAAVIMIVFDLTALFSGGAAGMSFAIAAYSVLSGIFAFIGSYLSIIFMQNMMNRIGFSGFAYYSWGAALFSVILSLIV